MFVYFQEKLKNFSELCTIPKGKGRNNNQNTPQHYNESPPAARKRRSASGSARTPFRGGPFCRCVFFLVSLVSFRLILGVSLSAAARSAAALVYDKLTPNCHPVFCCFT